MLRAVAHRGPDDLGLEIWHEETLGVSVGFGHARLAIIDLTPAGHQPMPNEDESVWVTFNGEIFNAPELMARQRASGHRFRSRADTEAILHGYEDRRDGVPAMLRGMFAFGVFDRRDGSVLLARDRLGKKPLYYSTEGSELVFASEIKAILAVRPALERLDPDAIDRYLTLHYVPGPGTIYRGIKKLPAGCTLRWQNGQATIDRYWAIPAAQERAVGVAQAEEELSERLDDAIRTRMLSDVPVGAFLSGGLDSAFLVARMQALSGQRLRTYTIRFAGTPYDEGAAAKRTADLLGTDHYELIVERVDPVDFEAAVRAADEPLADGALLPTYLLARHARHDVKVVLTGEGADEIFGGYPWYQLEQRVAPLYALPQWLRSGVDSAVRAAGGVVPRVVKTAARHLATVPDESAARWTRVFSEAEKTALYRPEFRAALNGTLHPYAALAETCRGLSPVRRAQWLDTAVLLPDDLLMKVDKATMAHGLEARSPFLDHELVEYAATLPDSMFVRPTGGKLLFRQVAGRSLPAELARSIDAAGKLGFFVPTAQWLERDLRSLAETALSDVTERLFAAVLAPGVFGRVLGAATNGASERSIYQAWTLFNLAVWSMVAPWSL
jgi:asparagine synthase (glutamine-hydrolysing)